MAQQNQNNDGRNRNRGVRRPHPSQNNATTPVAVAPANLSSLGQTILAYLQGANIMQKAFKLYCGLFVGILLLYASQFAAGAIAFNHGRVPMAMFELVVILALLFVCFLPHILLTGGVVATAAAINSPNLLTDQALIKTVTFWVKGFLSVCAYTVGIVFTVLLLFDIQLVGYAGLAILIVVGTFIGIFTVIIGDADTVTIKVMRAGLIGFVVMMLTVYIPGTNGESIIRDWFVTHNVLAGFAVAIVLLIGTTNIKTLWGVMWSTVIWLANIKNLLKLIGLALFLFLVYWFLNIKEGTEIVTAKVTEIADVISVPTAKNDSQSKQSATPKASSVNEGEWKEIGTKTCKVGWNNADFKNGWCLLKSKQYPLGIYPAGEYRFEITSSLKLTSNDGSVMSIPVEGVSIKQWEDSGDTEFAEFMKTWSLISNGQVGMVIIKIADKSPMSSREVTLLQDGSLQASVNDVPTQQSWEKNQLNGEITITIFKKK